LPLKSFAVQVRFWLAMRQMQMISVTAAASHLGARSDRADQAGDQGLAFWRFQVKLGGGIERFALARLAQQRLYLLNQSGYHGGLVCVRANRIQIAYR
jgi:hypothetical protein